jgi:predicted secreted Zn-dependent protease
LALHGCALLQPAPQDLVEKGDHAGLAKFYKAEAQELREKATVWDTLAESYERHPEPHTKIEPQQHAAHCRAVAASYRKAADEADALATEHQQQIPQRQGA